MMRRLPALLFVLMAATLQPAHAARVQEVVSPGGIKAWLIEEHSLPLVAARITFTGAGNAYDPDGKEGRANMVSALLMEGAGGMDARAFAEALENRAIALNAEAGEDLFNLRLEALSEHKDEAFAHLGLALIRPRFDSGSIGRVKTQFLSIIAQQQSRPGYLAHRKWRQVAFGSHPYGKDPLGDRESISRLGSGDFTDFTRRYLTRGNIIISVVGDITPGELETLLDTHLGGLPEHYRPDTAPAETALPNTAQTHTVTFDVPQTTILFGTQGIRRDDPHYMSAHVMNHILGNGLNSRLSKEIREKQGMTYAISSYLKPMKYAAAWQGGFATRNELAGAALESLRKTLRDFAADGPTDAEFQDAKRYLKGSFVLGLDSNADLAAFLTVMQLHHLGIDYLERRNELVEQVTREAVEDMARKLADPGRLIVTMAGKPQAAAGGGNDAR